MRAAIVGGIIAIITLAAYGIVQAGRWAPAALQSRIETPAPVAVEPAPAVAAEASAVPAATGACTRWSLPRTRSNPALKIRMVIVDRWGSI